MSLNPAHNPLLQGLIDQIVGPLSQLRATNYATAAVFTVLLYDVALTLSREIEYIWKTSWSLPKILYIIARYGGILDVGIQLFVNTQTSLSIPFCRVYIWWIALGNATITEWVVNIILMLRVHALYGRRWKFLVALIVVVMVQIGLEMWATVRSAIQGSTHLLPSSPLLPIPGCLFGADGSPSWQFTLIAWIPGILVATFFFILTAYKFYENATAAGEYSQLGWKDFSPVFLALMRDGTVIFLLVAAVLIFGAVFLTTVHNGLENLVLPYVTGTLSMAGTRLVLNLREAAAEGSISYGRSTIRTIPGMQFEIKESTSGGSRRKDDETVIFRQFTEPI